MGDQTPQIESQQESRKTEAIIRFPSLSLDIPDHELSKLIGTRIDEDERYYKEKLQLPKRRELMEAFWRGKQIDESQLDTNWQLSYMDNQINENLEQRISLASTKLPDIIVIPPKDDPVSRSRARKIDRALDIRINNENMRRLIKDALRDNHLSLIGCVKVRWDENEDNGKGDFIFEKISPKKISMDHTATIPHDGYSADNMETIYEWIEEPVGLICAKFPDKKDELLKKIGIVQGTTKQMASKIRYQEVWFTWYDKDGKQQEGVCWKYGKMILGKSKNPYYDWEGIEKEQQQPSTDENGQPQPKKVKNVLQNYFDKPRKPYIFFNHMNIGNSPIDDTSPVEQCIPLQQNINKRGRQITEISDNAVPKKVFSGTAITKEEARRVSNDPSEHIWLEDAEDVNKAFSTVHADPPSPILIQDLIMNRQQIDAKFGIQASKQRQMTGGRAETATQKQIVREGESTITDDLVETVVVRAMTEMSGWALQMIKTQYNQEHEFRAIGKDGDLTTMTLDQTSVDEGIGVQVRASTTDKVRRRAEALQLAQAKVTDPLSLFEDLDVPNPKERTERFLTFQKGQMDGYQAYEKMTGLDQGSGVDSEGNIEMSGLDGEQALEDIQNIKEGKPIESRGIPTVQYVEAFAQFVNSSELQNLTPEIQQKFQQFVQDLKSRVDTHAQGGQPPQGQQPPQGGQPTPRAGML